MQNIQVGNICKFEDFEPSPDRKACYKIGQVTSVTDQFIKYTALADIWEGEPFAGACINAMSTPMPGSWDGDWASRIQVLS